MRRNLFTKVKTAKKRKSSSTRWLQRQLNDPYVKEAKYLGYRSRAAFKIIEIDKKFKIFKKGKIVADLGAAPGGWSQFVIEKVGSGNVVAIDLLEMDVIDGVKFIQGDFTDPNIQKEFIKNIPVKKDSKPKFNIILTDMAANCCGDKDTDHLRMIDLLEDVMKFADKFMQKGGVLVAKSFQGSASYDFFSELKKKFSVIKNFKPSSSRKESSEIYIIATGFKIKDI